MRGVFSENRNYFIKVRRITTESGACNCLRPALTVSKRITYPKVKLNFGGEGRVKKKKGLKWREC